MTRTRSWFLVLAVGAMASGCGRAPEPQPAQPAKPETKTPAVDQAPAQAPPTPRQLPQPTPGPLPPPLPPDTVARLIVDEGAGGPAIDVAWSADGARLATAAAQGAVRIWDAATWTLSQTIAGPADPYREVALDRTGARVLSNHSSTVQLHDGSNGALVASMDHGGQTFAVAMSPAGDSMASAGAGGVQLWTSEGAASHRVAPGNGSKKAVSLAYAADGATLASGWGDGKIRMVDPATGVIGATIETGVEVETLALSATGTRVAARVSRRRSAVFEVGTRARVATLDFTTPLALDAGGNLLVATGREGAEHSVDFIDVAVAEIARDYIGHGAQVHAAILAPDGLLFATASEDASVLVWVAP